MAATPQNGTMTFVGQSGRIYSINFYLSDVAAAAVRFSQTTKAGASSDTSVRLPENAVLRDIAVVTGTADTTSITLTSDGAIKNGAVFMYTPHLTTIANRPQISIGFEKGALIGALQNA